MKQPSVQILHPLEAALPSQGRDVDGAYLIQLASQRFVAHTEFHRRHQNLETLALDVGEAQLRLFRRERLQVLSHVWYLYGSPSEPVLEEVELRVGAPLSRLEGTCCHYTRVNLRGLRWEDLLRRAPSSLWALAPLTQDGASAVAVKQVRDVIEGQADLTNPERADRLAILWFMAEAEGAPGAMIREYLSEAKLMESELYQSILNKGFDQGIEQGIEQGMLDSERRTIAALLVSRLGSLDDELRARLDAETSLPVLTPWYNQAVSLSDEASAQRLADHIRRAPYPKR